jgi:hypothetical protein
MMQAVELTSYEAHIPRRRTGSERRTRSPQFCMHSNISQILYWNSFMEISTNHNIVT